MKSKRKKKNKKYIVGISGCVDITKEELTKAIRKLKNGKALRQDKITNEMARQKYGNVYKREI